MSLNNFECNKCDISRNRTHLVYGQGDVNSPIMIVSESIGYKEDKTGITFSSKTGEYFKNILIESGFNLDDIYFTTLIKCRINAKRKPLKKEIDNCKEWLKLEVNTIQPKLVIYLGSVLSNLLLKGIGRKSNKLLFEKDKVYYYFAYHPNFVQFNADLLDTYYKQNFKKLYIKYIELINPPIVYKAYD